MINKELFYELGGVSRKIKQTVPTPHLLRKPDSETFYIIEKGFMYEVYFIDGDKLVSWFWGDGDVVIPTSPYSTLVVGQATHTSTYTYREMFRNLRKSENFRRVYGEIRERHNKAVAERINDLRKLSPVENYVKLLERKPWVFERAEEEVIASYLRISVGALRRFRVGKA